MPGYKAMKTRASRDHWSALSDEDLLNVSLTTDDPGTLEGLVTEIPERHEDAHVESRYDFRKQDRSEVVCVHCHQGHKAGFVMSVDGKRFLVGWICGKSIYGEDFERITQNYDAAVDRQNALRRAKQIREAIDPFTFWLEQMSQAGVFASYADIRRQWKEQIPWLFDQLRIKCLKHGGQIAVRETVRDTKSEQQDQERYQRELEIYAKGGQLPEQRRTTIYKEQEKLLCLLPAQSFFEDQQVDLQQVVVTIANEIFIQMTLLRRALNNRTDIEPFIKAIRERLTKLENAISVARELEDLFQPLIMAAIAEWANHSDNSKRSYRAGLTAITMTNNKGDFTISLPSGYRAPERSAIGNFRAALAGLYSLPRV